MVFFGVLELISDEFDIYNPGVVMLRMKKITKNLQLSRQKTVRILRFFDEKAKINSKKSVSFLVDIEKNIVTINCKRLAELCDNHTQKKLKNTTKSLQSENEVTSSQEEEEEEEEDKKNKEHTSFSNEEGEFYITKRKRKLSGKRLLTFNQFWDVFNYKSGKAEAADAWLDIPELTDPLVKKIMEVAKIENDKRKARIDKGKTPKMAQGWISGRRWEDEHVSAKSKYAT